MSRRGFARLLWRLADLVGAAERGRSFRAKAYRRAIWSLDRLDPSLEVPNEQVLASPGIGPGIAALLSEYRDTGSINQLIPLETAYPRDVVRFRRLPRMSPRILRDLKGELGVETEADLLNAIDTGAGESIRGVGRQTIELWRRILEMPPDNRSVPSHQAWTTAEAIGHHIGDHLDCRVDVAGQVRRVTE